MQCHSKQLNNSEILVYLNMSGTFHYSENEHTADHVQAAFCTPMVLSVHNCFKSSRGEIY